MGLLANDASDLLEGVGFDFIGGKALNRRLIGPLGIKGGQGRSRKGFAYRVSGSAKAASFRITPVIPKPNFTLVS